MNSSERKVNVIGLGYIGLPTALLLAETGFDVSGIDSDEEKINSLNIGKLYFDEPGVFELFEEVCKEGKINFYTQVQKAGIHLICVPTPVNVGKADLTYVKNALNSLDGIAGEGDLVILESTIGPNDYEDELSEIIKKLGVHFALCTERAIPGNTLYEMKHNDRVIGVEESGPKEDLLNLYGSFVSGKISFTNVKTAALVKVIENTYRSVNIAFANELAKLADKNSFDVWEAIALANNHPRVNVHLPGPGVGGHCIPIDPYFLVDKTEDTQLIDLGLQVNEEMADYVTRRVLSLIQDNNIDGKTVSLLGYAYKKNVDDSRETPAKEIQEKLEANNLVVILSDPYVNADNVVDTEKALRECEVAILVTDHDEYKEIDFSKYPNISMVYDCRNHIAEHQTNGLLHYFLGK